MNKVLILIGLSILSGILYRVGGWEKGNKLFRRIGCPVCSFLLLPYNIWNNPFCSVTAFILSVLAMSTYHDYLTPNGSEDWKCWLMTGFCYSLATIPLIWAGIGLPNILIRGVLLGLVIMLIRENTDIDVNEEVGSGFFYCLTTPLILL